MAAFYWKRPTAADAGELGLKPEDYKEPCAELWAEHEAAFWLFMQNHTQWRPGPGGVVGLDYTVFFHDLDRRGLTNEQFDEMMAVIRMIEQAALAEIYKS